METMVGAQPPPATQRKSSVEEKNGQCHYTFTPKQLENAKKNV